MTARRSVLFFVHLLSRFEADFGALARHLIASGVMVRIFTPRSTNGSESGISRGTSGQTDVGPMLDGATIERLPLWRGRPSIASLAATARLALRWARSSPDSIAVFWSILPIISCGLPMRMLNRHCIFLVTGLGSVFGSSDLKLRLARVFVKRVYQYLFSGTNSRVVVHNREDAAYLVTHLQTPAAHVTVTPGCGIDPKEYPFFARLSQRRPMIVLVTSRLLVEKGILDAVRASEQLHAQGLQHELWFSCWIDEANPSSLGQKDLHRIEQYHPWIRFLGFQPSILPLLEQAAAVCIPTRYREGLPTSLLEAASCGRPIVTTDNVGCRAFVENGLTGLMVPPGDSAALARALRRVLSDPEFAEILRHNAYERFLAGFTKDVMVSRTVDVLRDLDLELASSRVTGFTSFLQTEARQQVAGHASFMDGRDGV